MIIYSQSGNKFQTRGERLSQIDLETGKGFRSVSRKQVREVFRGVRHEIDGLYPESREVFRNAWRASGSEVGLSIGCQDFSGLNFQVIRKWAFKRKKKKA